VARHVRNTAVLASRIVFLVHVVVDVEETIGVTLSGVGEEKRALALRQTIQVVSFKFCAETDRRLVINLDFCITPLVYAGVFVLTCALLKIQTVILIEGHDELIVDERLDSEWLELN